MYISGVVRASSNEQSLVLSAYMIVCICACYNSLCLLSIAAVVCMHVLCCKQ